MRILAKTFLILLVTAFLYSCHDLGRTVPISELDDSVSGGQVDDGNYSINDNETDNNYKNDDTASDDTEKNDSSDQGKGDSEFPDVYPGWMDSANSSPDEGDQFVDEEMEIPDEVLPEENGVFTSLTVGSEHTCALSEVGFAYCWGGNNFASLGKQGVNYSSVPIKPDLEHRTLSISCGYNHCACRSDHGTLYRWGDNTYGQLLLLVTDSNHFIETPIMAFMFAVGDDYALGAYNSFSFLRSYTDGSNVFYGCGKNHNGQLGDGTTMERDGAVKVDMTGALKNSFIVSIDSAETHTCAVNTTGGVFCWGDNSSGQLGIGTTVNSYSPVKVDMTGVLFKKKVEKVSLGLNYSCVLDDKGKVYCWGSLLDFSSKVPKEIALDNPVVSLSVNKSNACVLDEAGKIWCWGKNESGQLGNLSFDDSEDPVEVDLGNRNMVDVKTGTNHVCALDDAGNIFCWGSNGSGQLGYGKGASSVISGVPQPTRVIIKSDINEKKVSLLSCGYESTSAVDEDGNLYFWGRPDLNSLEYSHIAKIEGTGDEREYGDVAFFGTGAAHKCLLDSEGDVYCWGNNNRGQLGNNSDESSDQPEKIDVSGVLNDKNIKMLSVGEYHNCVLDAENKIYCWGDNGRGQLGNGQIVSSKVPVEVNMNGDLNGKTVKTVKCGTEHTCALDTEGTVYCWGANNDKQLGDNTGTDKLYPTKVYTDVALKDKKIVNIDTGRDHTCAVDENSKIYCWGANMKGQVGVGYTSANYNPVAVDMTGVLKDKNISEISCGYNSSCVLDENGKAYCWGEVPGNGVDEESPVPVEVLSDGALSEKVLVSISVGYDHVCGLDTEGDTYCWGSNKTGQLGSGYLGLPNTPYKVFRSISE